MEVLVQSSSGIIINVTNDNEATVRSLMSEFGRLKENGQGMHATGTFYVAVIKENWEWKFFSRRQELLYFDNLPVPGGTKNYKY